MTDRELLEAAAKAAGLEPFNAWGKTFVMGDGSPPKAEWNPLTDDGDALRLAVKLRVDFMTTGHLIDGTEVVSVIFPVNGDCDSISEPHGSDPYAATRRAIVRAAAAMGEKA